MQLETKRLLIREFVPGDVRQVHEYASDPAVAKYMIWGPNSLEDTREYIRHMLDLQQEEPRQGFEYAVVLKESNKLAGGCGLHISGAGQGEIGYCFNPSYWGQGYASEASAALLEWGFQELGLHRIYATCRPENIGSARVMQKLGMIYEGHLRGHMYHKGKWMDSYQYSILKEEYQALHR
ncbi:GNAT family N-acetyltransferase [Paenibacillus tritici]|uniref:GNAT family N-acetyltransferase n=1 Tax=Paenibacillus tritici TaxID=1873425 RepID=UPI001BA62149|nr:GNAT family protein [Paenibacillus tritici]QUL54050.1 GNAT family N-acetyltransferase [Paenibacillus tritici]